MPLLSLNGVGIDYGAGPLLQDVSVAIERGEHWGLVGRNGTGKTPALGAALHAWHEADEALPVS